MKISLGKKLLFFVFIAWHVALLGSEYEWSATIDKKEAYVYEAIYLHYTCLFTDRAELYAIDFNPVGEYEAFSLKLLRQTRDIIDGKRVENYEYVAFAKKAGELRFDFDMVMKKTNRDSIENAVIGRDNVQSEEFTKRYMKQQTLSVHVSDSGLEHTGRYTMQVNSSEPNVEAFLPYHMEIVIEGEGNFAFKPFSFSVDGVEIFAETPQVETILTPTGYVGSWRQKFAFVSDKSFRIDSLGIEYWNTHNAKVEKLTTPTVEVVVREGMKKEELLDPKEKENEVTLPKEWLFYLLFFITGFLVAKSKISFKKSSHAMDESFEVKIKATKSLGELALLLAMQEEKRFEELLLMIETKKVTSLKETQKKALQLISG